MTGNKIFLDSNIIIEVFAGNKEIADKLNGLPTFYISSIVLGELYVGINRVLNKNKHLNKLTEFLELCTILEVDQTTAQFFGEITAALYKKGKPIPTNDIWIAATVKQHNLKLISRDKHFTEIDDMLLESW
ncbi:type II toxin-antitoxin system VapC family toxin [Mucilaginibacter sp. McL0603]|uniref:type II toxin-antitoxin system VapC family toxin n=1 Tax=Mucilaginibacter sp. McL0603 TaxID=3415670 RepID=UPI003CF1DAF7